MVSDSTRRTLAIMSVLLVVLFFAASLLELL
jgi:uncharacterized membrane protein